MSASLVSVIRENAVKKYEHIHTRETKSTL